MKPPMVTKKRVFPTMSSMAPASLVIDITFRLCSFPGIAKNRLINPAVTARAKNPRIMIPGTTLVTREPICTPTRDPSSIPMARV